MRTILLTLPNNNELAERLLEPLGAELGECTMRGFPDGETYIRIVTNLTNSRVIILASLDRPDDKILSLIFLAETAKAHGVHEVGLITPYLAYMRQDREFNPGEGVSARYFARLLSQSFSWIVTIDPHLHRLPFLGEIFSIPTKVLHAAETVRDWIKLNVKNPVIFGPDEESGQWVRAAALKETLPFVIFNKKRISSTEVRLTLPNIDRFKEHTPILFDDIISTGQTMIATTKALLEAGLKPPVCIGIHGLFAGSAYQDLQDAGAAMIVTTNTIHHPSNAIDIAPLLAKGVIEELLGFSSSRDYLSWVETALNEAQE
jgi:ribose-phosphate pyrophosphokinase